ncbi:MAG: hypothetical protein M1379_01775 [Firmicutes bacterium]|nr:hypothetical protein [Bacillota bacterium]
MVINFQWSGRRRGIVKFGEEPGDLFERLLQQITQPPEGIHVGKQQGDGQIPGPNMDRIIAKDGISFPGLQAGLLIDADVHWAHLLPVLSLKKRQVLVRQADDLGVQGFDAPLVAPEQGLFGQGVDDPGAAGAA